MRDDIETRKKRHDSGNHTLTFVQEMKLHTNGLMNQCELNNEKQTGSGGLGLHLNNHIDYSYVADIYVGNKPP